MSTRQHTHAIDRFLKLMNDRGASDLHISVGRPPLMRISGRMDPIRFRLITEHDFERMIRPAVPDHLWQRYQQTGDCDLAYEVDGLARFRVNLFQQHRGAGAVFRVIPSRVMTIDQLGLPKSVGKLAQLRGGLVLVTGPTGSGKSTTLAAIIHQMANQRPMHIVTIEDPIEFVHENSKALVSQREVGQHSRSFADAVKAAVREDPDCILVGEMRDLETIEIALDAAETGVLVFATLHTNSAAKTIDRIINVFPSDRHDGVRGVLASVIKGVLSQQLLRRARGGRVAAVEVLFGLPALSSLIREGKTHQVSSFIQANKAMGMYAMDESLRDFVAAGIVHGQVALEKAIDKDAFREWLRERGDEVPDDVETRIADALQP